MPESPDLQVFSQNLNKKLSGKKLERLTITNKSKLKTPEKDFKESLEKQELKKVYREGKELRFKFSNDNILGFHLMLNGKMYLSEKRNEHKNTIIELSFENDSCLALTDYQGIANATLNPEEKTSPDVMSDKLDFKYLKDVFSKKRTVVKTLLLDQNVIRGIGNAYADEILWDALISPFSVCKKIPEEKIKTLAKSIKTVLQDAEKKILKTHPDIISGEVRDFLKIHNPKKESPSGAAILQTVIGGRKTYYTGEQELFT